MKYLSIPSKLYEQNRQRFIKKMKPISLVIFPASPVFPKSGDGLYGYKRVVPDISSGTANKTTSAKVFREL